LDEHLETLLRSIRAARPSGTTEAQMQAAVQAVLDAAGVRYERERPCGSGNRLDFYLSDWRTALELKIEGGPSAVLRQLHRYAEQPDVAVLVLLTRKAAHRSLPRMLLGKPLHVLFLWEHAL
jgi:hypothetical protein